MALRTSTSAAFSLSVSAPCPGCPQPPATRAAVATRKTTARPKPRRCLLRHLLCFKPMDGREAYVESVPLFRRERLGLLCRFLGFCLFDAFFGLGLRRQTFKAHHHCRGGNALLARLC